MNWIDSFSVRYFFRTSEWITIALKWIRTELNLRLVNCELNWTLHTINRPGGWTELLSDEFQQIIVWIIISVRTEVILTVHEWVYFNKLWLIQNKFWTKAIMELNYGHHGTELRPSWNGAQISESEFRTEVNWIYNSEKKLELNRILKSGNLLGSKSWEPWWVLGTNLVYSLCSLHLTWFGNTRKYSCWGDEIQWRICCTP